MSNVFSWSNPTDFETVRRRAGGRRKYNAVRQFQALMRQRDILELIKKNGGLGSPSSRQAALARQLGVSRSTVCRDFTKIFHSRVQCPFCGSIVHPEQVNKGPPWRAHLVQSLLG